MSMEGPPDEDKEIDRFEELQGRAVWEIWTALATSGKYADTRIIGEEADKIFQKRYEQAVRIYTRAIEEIENQSTRELRQEGLRELLQRMAKSFSQDGYVEATTAQRLASALMHLLESFDDDDEGMSGREGGTGET